jgi:hypothetical protein
MTGPSSLPSGVFSPSALPRKPSGTPSNRFFQSRVRPTLPPKILWIVRSCSYWLCGRRSNWSEKFSPPHFIDGLIGVL